MGTMTGKLFYSDIIGFNAYGRIELLTSQEIKGQGILWVHCISSLDQPDFLQAGDFVLFHVREGDTVERLIAKIADLEKYDLAGIMFIGTEVGLTAQEKANLAAWGNERSIPLLYSTNLTNVSAFCKKVCLHIIEQSSFKNVRDELIRELLVETDYDKPAIVNGLRQLGFNKQVTYCSAVIRISNQSRPLTPRERSVKLQEFLNTLYNLFDCFVCGSEFDDSLVVILPDIYQGKTIHQVLVDVVKAANEKETSVYYRCGIGPRWVNIDDFRKSTEVATKLARLPHRLSVRDIKTQVIFRVLCQFEHHEDLFELYLDVFGPLIEHDSEHGTDLMRCLKIYLENGQNLTLAAEEAFLHVNTFRSRIAQIEEILNVDLRGDRWNMFRYYFCFFVEDFLSANTNLLESYPVHSHLTHREHFGMRPMPPGQG